MSLFENVTQLAADVPLHRPHQALEPLMRWLQLRVDFDSTAVWFPFDCNSTALRPFDGLRYQRMTL